MNKHQSYMHCLDKWMQNRERDLWIADYFREHKEPKLGIYGYGMLGKHLLWELEKHDYPISWIMDKSNDIKSEKHSIIGLKELDSVSKVDVVIVTALADFENIELLLCAYNIGKPVGLDELIDILSGGAKLL